MVPARLTADSHLTPSSPATQTRIAFIQEESARDGGGSNNDLSVRPLHPRPGTGHVAGGRWIGTVAPSQVVCLAPPFRREVLAGGGSRRIDASRLSRRVRHRRQYRP